MRLFPRGDGVFAFTCRSLASPGLFNVESMRHSKTARTGDNSTLTLGETLKSPFFEGSVFHG